MQSVKQLELEIAELKTKLNEKEFELKIKYNKEKTDGEIIARILKAAQYSAGIFLSFGVDEGEQLKKDVKKMLDKEKITLKLISDCFESEIREYFLY